MNESTTPKERAEWLHEIKLGNVCGMRLTYFIKRIISEVEHITKERDAAISCQEITSASLDESLIEIERLEEEIGHYSEDLIDAAGGLTVSDPKPGTTIAKLLIANKLIRNERDKARSSRDSWKKRAENFEKARNEALLSEIELQETVDRRTEQVIKHQDERDDAETSMIHLNKEQERLLDELDKSKNECKRLKRVIEIIHNNPSPCDNCGTYK